MEQQIKRWFVILILVDCDEKLREQLVSLSDENISILYNLLGNIYIQHDYFVSKYECEFYNIENHTMQLLDNLVEFAKCM